MSLTILIHPRLESVAIVRWFLDTKVSISYASGPVAEMPLSEFRATGYEWVRDHFSEFATKRVSESDVVPPFGKSEAKGYMEDRDVIEIRRQPSGELRFIPAVVRRCDLGGGLEILETEKRRTISGDCSPELFWRTFDEVLSFSHEYAA
jgi:hypothetical protein